MDGGSILEDDLLKDVDLETADLELDLTQPGNYTFELTVTDSQGLTDSAKATVVVTEEQDDPPTANAGKSMSINLPSDTGEFWHFLHLFYCSFAAKFCKICLNLIKLLFVETVRLMIRALCFGPGQVMKKTSTPLI